MKRISFVLSLIILKFGYSQPNCHIYKMENNHACYEACIIATEKTEGQGSKSSQENFDKAIALCPSLDYAYREKSVPYLKRGDFVTWKKLIDKAVELNPTLHLGARGWCKYQFVRDYHGAIKDFEQLESLTRSDIGYSVNGDYHLNMAKALCYKAIGQKGVAMEIFERQLAQRNYTPLSYDFLHLGILKMETGDSAGAKEYLNKSIAYNDYLAEPYYYLGLIYKKEKSAKEFKVNMEKAKTFYLKGYKHSDPYTHPMDKIYLADIEQELNSSE